LEGACFNFKVIRKILRKTNHDCCPTSLSCRKFNKSNTYSYSRPIFCENSRKALVFVQSSKKDEQMSGELFILIKAEEDWEVEKIIDYYKV
jgi:hypothetical protein